MCGKFCDGNRKVTIKSLPICLASVCYKCDCDVTCSVYGTCCPHLHPSTPLGLHDLEVQNYLRRSYNFLGNLSDLELKDANIFSEYSRTNPDPAIDEKFYGRFRCLPINYRDSNTIEKIFGIVTCPDTETDERLRRLCQSNDLDLVRRESLLPVTDVRDGVVYKNVYCLICWQRNETGVVDSSRLADDPTELPELDDNFYQQWDLTVECMVYQGFYQMTNTSKFLSAVMKSIRIKPIGQDPMCEVRYSSYNTKDGNPLKHKPCFLHPDTTPPCKGSINNDDVTSDLCVSINKPAYSIAGSYNAFCDICNDQALPCLNMVDSRTEPPTSGYDLYVASPINLLLGDQSAIIRLDDGNTEVNETYLCPRPLEWMDETNVCRLPSCTQGKVLDVASGRCKTPISVIKGLGYKLYMVLVPNKAIPSAYSLKVKQNVNQFHNHFMASSYLSIHNAVFGTDQSDGYDVIKYIKIEGHFVAIEDKRRDDFETELLEYEFKFKVNNSTVTLTPIGMGVDYKRTMEMDLGQNPDQTYDLIQATIYGNQTFSEPRIGKPMSTRDVNPLAPPTDPPQPITFKDILSEKVGRETNSHPTWKMKSEFIDMTPTLMCPFVVFDIKESSVINDTNLLVTFDYNGQEKTIDASAHVRNISIEGQKLKICIETFREEFQKTILSKDSNIEITWMSVFKRYLTISCLVLSVICLLMTSVTYFLFSQLRTLPGLNTMSLCLTLASADVTLILVVELVGRVEGYACIALGILLHYAWMCSFCWMGVCCVHMYLVFRGTNTRHISSRSPVQKHRQYALVAFGTPAVIVSGHVSVCEIVSQGKTTGYSDKVCFFDTDWSIVTVMVSFVTPLAILMVINAVLFGITVREMVAVRRLQAVSRVKSRDELLTYVKLSTITGVQWLVSLMAVGIGSDVSDIIVAILVGLQGVFIFVSFTLNKKTKGLCRNLYGGDRASLVSSSDNRKISHSSNTQATDV